MSDLLDKHFAGYKDLFDFQTSLSLALRMGFQPKFGEPSLCNDVKRWLAEHLSDPKSQAIIEFGTRRPGGDGWETCNDK